MDVLMDGLLMAATLFAGGYCWVLARRVHDLKSLDKGLGGAIVTLTRQIELARATLDEAQSAGTDKREELARLIARADSATGELKLALATARHLEPAEGHADDAPEARGRDDMIAPPIRRPASPVPFGAGDPPVSAKLAEPGVAPAVGAVAGPTVEAELPKPRALPPIGNPLRRREPIAPIRSEDDLMAALSNLAAGGER